MDKLEKNEMLGDLYAYYGCLLTKGQQNYFEDYYYNDLSLGEIATNHKVSRQAVYDNLQRCQKLLINYENRLHMQRDYNEIEHKLACILDLVEQKQSKKAVQLINDVLKQMRGE